MSRPLILGLMAEGVTDVRFLSSVIARTFEQIIITESDALPEIYQIEIIEPISGSFNEKVLHAASVANESGITILCVHTDSDSKTDKASFENKIHPAFSEVARAEGALCKTLVAVVPVQMTEAWMLADIDLLKDELMTDKSNEKLQLTRLPENIANPKDVIKNAIYIAREGIPKRRKQYEITISDLYLPIGQKITLEKLVTLPSYRKFVADARRALLTLHFI